jgi:hypothetical protein
MYGDTKRAAYISSQTELDTQRDELKCKKNSKRNLKEKKECAQLGVAM